MTTNSSALNIQNGVQVASALAGKKTGKRLTAAGLSELFSNISQPVKSVTKSNTVSFKKIFEPAKAASGVTVATVEQPQKKKAKTTGDQIICVPFPPVIKQADVIKQAQVNKQIPEAKASPLANHVSSKEPVPQNSKLPNQNIKPTIAPRSPVHGEILGNNDSGRTLITDGPKAKENAPAQKNVAVIQPSIEVNTASPKIAKSVRSSTESKAASDNASEKGTVSKFQTASVQSALPPQAATIPVSESKVKSTAAKVVATGTEKVRVSHQVSDSESNSKNIMDKQVKSAQPRPEVAEYKQARASAASDVTTAAPVKTDVSFTAVSEQFAPPTISNAGVANTNTPAATGNSVANVHEQVASAAAAASYKIGQKITVNLNPPELGKISIKFEKNGDEVIGRIEVEKSQTKNQIDLNLPQIVQNLQDSGVQIKRFEVVLQEQPLGNQQEFAGHTQHDWEERQHFGSEKNYSDIPTVFSANDQFSYAAPGDAYFSDKSVNILV